MKIITSDIKIEYFSSKIYNEYFDNQKLVTFDIETMGLNSKNSELILSCFMHVTKDGIGHITQFFLDTIDEESLLLSKTLEELNKYDVVLTYNGTTFDLPFVKERGKTLGVMDNNIKAFNFDLFPTICHNSNLKDILSGLKQKDIEEYLQISSLRNDQISGKESIDLFVKYLSENDESIKDEYRRKILLHNYDDVLQLYRLLPIIKQINFHRSRFKLGFPIKGINGWNDIYVSKLDIKNKSLYITGKHFEKDFSYISFDNNELQFDENGSFNIRIPLEKYKNDLFINLKEKGLENKNLSLLAGFTNGYLILKDKDINYKECNELAREVLINIMKKVAR